jgi:hypothetical protein
MTTEACGCWDTTTRMAFRRIRGRGARTRIEFDHKYKGQRVRFYDYTDAATLLADFWTDVDAILQEREGKG